MGVSNVPFCPIWGNDELRACDNETFINRRILNYIEFWKLGMSNDDSYSRVIGPHVKYYKKHFGIVIKTFPMIDLCFVGRFSPSSN
jgi:hypothetical protein